MNIQPNFYYLSMDDIDLNLRFSSLLLFESDGYMSESTETLEDLTYKQALQDASPSYKTRNEVKPEVVIPKQEKPKPTNKKKKVVENITLKL